MLLLELFFGKQIKGGEKDMGEYKYDLLRELKSVKGMKDTRSKAIRESRIKELKRLNVKIPKNYLY